MKAPLSKNCFGVRLIYYMQDVDLFIESGASKNCLCLRVAINNLYITIFCRLYTFFFCTSKSQPCPLGIQWNVFLCNSFLKQKVVFPFFLFKPIPQRRLGKLAFCLPFNKYVSSCLLMLHTLHSQCLCGRFWSQ